MCLVWRGERQEIGLKDDLARLEIAWDGEYELLGDFLRITSNHPQIRERAVGGYPLEVVPRLIERVQSFECKRPAKSS